MDYFDESETLPYPAVAMPRYPSRAERLGVEELPYPAADAPAADAPEGTLPQAYGAAQPAPVDEQALALRNFLSNEQWGIGGYTSHMGDLYAAQQAVSRTQLSQAEQLQLQRLQGGMAGIREQLNAGQITPAEAQRLSIMMEVAAQPLVVRASQLPIMMAQLRYRQMMHETAQLEGVAQQNAQFRARTLQQRIQAVRLLDGSAVQMFEQRPGQWQVLSPGAGGEGGPGSISPTLVNSTIGQIQRELAAEALEPNSAFTTAEARAAELRRRLQERLGLLREFMGTGQGGAGGGGGPPPPPRPPVQPSLVQTRLSPSGQQTAEPNPHAIPTAGSPELGQWLLALEQHPERGRLRPEFRRDLGAAIDLLTMHRSRLQMPASVRQRFDAILRRLGVLVPPSSGRFGEETPGRGASELGPIAPRVGEAWGT